MDESMIIASNKAVEYFTEGVVQGLNMIDHGLVIDTNRPLYPISEHRSERIFSLNKLCDFFVEGKRIDFTTGVERRQLEADSARELFRKVETAVTASGETSGFGVKISATAKAEYKYEESTKQNVKFAQIKLLCKVATVDLPEGEELRALLDETFKKRIDSISSFKEAKDFVYRYGATYIQDATWGGMLSLTTSTQVTQVSKSKSLLAELQAEVSTITSSGSVDVSASTEGKEVTNDRNFQYTLVGLGGSPSLVNDEELWMRSVGKRPALVSIKVGNIANLAIPGSDAAKHLLGAVEDDVLLFEKEFGFDQVLKGYQHLTKDHWKREEMNNLINKFIADQGSLYHRFKDNKWSKQTKDGKKKFKSSIDGTIRDAKGVQNKLKESKPIQDFILHANNLKDSHTAVVKRDSNPKHPINVAYSPSVKFLEHLLKLAQETGNHGFLGSIVSFYNEEHGRFLRVEAKKLVTTSPTNMEFLKEDNAEFVIRTVDKARGHVSIQCAESNYYLTVKKGVISFEKKMSNESKFSFFATKEFVSIRSVTEKSFLVVDQNTFVARMGRIVDDNSSFIVQECA